MLSAVDITLVYLPALGADRGLAAGFVGVLLTLRAVASMSSRLFLGRLVDWIGRRRLMIVSVTLSAVSWLVFTWIGGWVGAKIGRRNTSIIGWAAQLIGVFLLFR